MSREETIDACRSLLRNGRSGTLSTALAADAWPYGSLITYAADTDGSPIFLLSDLSDHTRNLKADPRVSLLVENATRRYNPQTGSRLSLLGKVRKSRDERQARRFLRRHPKAGLYAGFGDFAFYRMSIDRIHFVGGFARARWLPGRDVRSGAAAAKAIAAIEDSVLEHMNADHADAIDLIATRLLRRKGRGWRMCGLDPEGADLARANHWARLAFRESLSDAESVRAELVHFTRVARAQE